MAEKTFFLIEHDLRNNNQVDLTGWRKTNIINEKNESVLASFMYT